MEHHIPHKISIDFLETHYPMVHYITAAINFQAEETFVSTLFMAFERETAHSLFMIFPCFIPKSDPNAGVCSGKTYYYYHFPTVYHQPFQ